MTITVRLVRRGHRKSCVVTTAQDVANLLGPTARGLDREHFWCISLDARHAVIALELVSIGTLTAALVHPREVYKGALLANAASVIVAHNHPSNDRSPSPEDRETTRRLKEAGAILGVPLLDHVVLGGAGYYSFRESGLL